MDAQEQAEVRNHSYLTNSVEALDTALDWICGINCSEESDAEMIRKAHYQLICAHKTLSDLINKI